MAEKSINNSSFLPEYKPFGETSLEPSGKFLQSPDWVKSLIIEQVNVASASPDGKFSGMPFVLDHLAEMGINCIWLNPIHDGRHYYNYGPATVKPELTGTDDYEKGWQVVKKFVDEAHSRNIRVLFDIVTWGVNPEAPIVKEHPDWFDGYSQDFKGPLYNWHSTELFDWFSEQLLRIIRVTGADGFRADSSIIFCGPELYSKVRRVLHSEGRYIAIIGEGIREGTEWFFDFNEHSIDYWVTQEGTKFILGDVNFVSDYKADIVAAVKEGRGLDTRMRQAYGESGKLRFYSSIVSCHDSPRYMAKGSLTAIAYTSILSPFIPIWYIGEEWNNPYTGDETSKWLYANRIDWAKLQENLEFYESVKKTIRIRRLFPEIFECFPMEHRSINFCGVDVSPENSLPAYARYTNGYGIIVVPNYTENDIKLTVKIPLEEFGLKGDDDIEIVNLMNGTPIGQKGDEKNHFVCDIKAWDAGIYGVSKIIGETNPFAKLQ